MKKLLIAAIAVLGFTTANAQWAPEAGDIQTSISFTPFKSNGRMFDTVGLNATYFFDSKNAVRVGLDFSSWTRKDDDVKSSDFTFGFLAGYEYHFKTVDRLDLFAGGDGFFETYTSKERGHKVDGGYTSFGFDAFTGLNFYVYKNLYLGAELRLRYAHYNYNSYDVEVEDGIWENVDPKSSGNEFDIEALPSLKLGWKF